MQIVEYADYVQPNVALNSGELDANYFQHKPYMDDFNKQKGTKLVAMAFIHYEPFGIYGGRCKDLNKLKDGAIVSVPHPSPIGNHAKAPTAPQTAGALCHFTPPNKSHGYAFGGGHVTSTGFPVTGCRKPR